MKKIVVLIIFFVSLFILSQNSRANFLLEKIIQPEARVVFVGDMMFDRHIRTKNYADNYQSVLSKEIEAILKTADLAVGNLEGVITVNPSKSQYSEIASPDNFIFTFPPVVAEWLSDTNFKLVNLGNNHIDDFGGEGIEQTKKYLTDSRVAYLGEPDRLDNFVIKKINGLEIGFVNYNDFDRKTIDQIQTEIKKVKAEADFVVVYTHWGEEYILEPSARIKSLAHLLVSAGADLVIGSHPHIIQASENYQDALIYYSLGNFIFDQYFSDQVSCGLMLEVTFGQEIMVQNEYQVVMTSDGQTKLANCQI